MRGYSKFKKPIDGVSELWNVSELWKKDRCPFCMYTISQHVLPWSCLIGQVGDCGDPCTLDDWKRCPLRDSILVE